MSITQEERPTSRKTQVTVGVAVAVLLAGIVGGVGVVAHDAQVRAAAAHALTVAAPAYQGAISLGGDLDVLAAQSVQAKVAYDAEQARVAAEKAAQAAAAALAAQQAAAAVIAEQQAAAQQAAQADDTSNTDNTVDPEPVDPVPFVPDTSSDDGGRYDTSTCGAAGATLNPDGSVSCAG